MALSCRHISHGGLRQLSENKTSASLVPLGRRRTGSWLPEVIHLLVVTKQRCVSETTGGTLSFMRGGDLISSDVGFEPFPVRPHDAHDGQANGPEKATQTGEPVFGVLPVSNLSRYSADLSASCRWILNPAHVAATIRLLCGLRYWASKFADRGSFRLKLRALGSVRLFGPRSSKGKGFLKTTLAGMLWPSRPPT